MLLLTGARSTWGGFAIALVYSFVMLDGKSRRRLLAGVLGIVVMAAPLMMLDQLSEPIMQRIDTMQNVGDDNNYRALAESYRSFFSLAATDIAGHGFGSVGRGARLTDNSSSNATVDFDSGLLEVPFVMGWPGALLYTTGVLMLLWRACRASRLNRTDALGIYSAGAAVAIFSMMIFSNTLTSVVGLFFFLGVTLPVISLRYARELRGAAVAASSQQHKMSR